jgi:hypothetical protein
MIHTVRRLGVTLALALAVLATGCGDAGTPLTQPEGLPAFNASANSDVQTLARYRAKPQVTIAWAKKWIGPEGGRLDFYGFAIEVPRGAVTRSTMFTIRLPVDPRGSEHVVAEFGPHNQRFRQPVAIELPFRNTSIEAGSNHTVVWWNEGWTDMGATVTRDGQRLRTLTDHFSTYGTTNAQLNGTLVLGGG